ncbi:hypothetical protein I6E61_09155 [Psychrobacter sp. NZS113]|uniref:hypothetical protein n=1 Tax=Psychrobacter sp. NZS113 TaxID=2792045 RepID=UPI0018CE8CC3|nr:hypothetical protein [Psychrobacter sp. NZS113]MBH0096549.1 hypothetical protein [Psychrobacter sp. NZS113]
MKISNMSLFSCLLITSVLSTPVNAQTEDSIKKLVEKNVVEACDCVKNIDYIDNFIDFNMKFDQCIQSENNSLLKQEEAYQTYNDLMYERVESCGNFAKTVDDFLQHPEPKLSDPIYNNQKQYKEIAKSIVGQYSMSFGNYSPEGGASLALLDNQRYVIVGFGVVLVGDWRIVKGKYLHLIPHRTEYPFYVFGRHNTELKDKTKIRFKGSGFSESTLIRYGEISQDTPILMPILHIDNQYPYDAKIPHIPRALSLAYNSDYENNDDEAIDIYTFDNDEELNDLYVLEFNKLARREVMKAIIGDDELTFDQGTTTKRPLPRATSENAEFYKEISDIKPFPKTLYYNLAGRSFDSRDIKQYNYTFDDNLKAYVANIKCHEDCPAADDYDNTDIFYEYKSLEDITVQQSKFKIANTFAVPRD